MNIPANFISGFSVTVRNHHNEFITARSGNDIIFSDTAFYHLADGYENFIPNGMTEIVVNQLQSEALTADTEGRSNPPATGDS